jgi:hypothetical protein
MLERNQTENRAIVWREIRLEMAMDEILLYSGERSGKARVIKDKFIELRLQYRVAKIQ